MAKPFNPLDLKHLAASIHGALLRQTAHAMPPPERFEGPGIYALYYTGNFPAYRKIAEANGEGRFEAPIYVGRSERKGARKGGTLHAKAGETALYSRLREHARSITEAENLDVTDFHFRCLLVDDIWIPLGEALAIDRYAPVWNKMIDGFGGHTPGKGRKGQVTSSWDTLHPGRAFVKKVGLPPSPKGPEDLIEEVQAYLDKPYEEQELEELREGVEGHLNS